MQGRDQDDDREKLTLEQLIILLNQCSEQHQNTIFNKEMWVSELLYLSKKHKKQHDIEQGHIDNHDDDEDQEERLRRLLKIAQKTAEAFDKENEEGNKKLSKSQIKSKKTF